jgi:hypothetical protein
MIGLTARRQVTAGELQRPGEIAASKRNGGRSMRIWMLASLLSLLPTLSEAQDKDQVRNQAAAINAQMHALGEPRDRCSLGANIHNGPVVIRTNTNTVLKPGDRLVVVNHISVADKSPDDVIAHLREIAPTAEIPVTVDRDGQLVDLDVTCVNARQTIEPMMNAIGFAAKGKFDDCVNAISQMTDVDTRTAMVKVQCAAVSRNAKKYDVPAMLAQVMTMAIEDARYAASMRPEVVQQLHNVEGTITQGLGAARFQSLVAMTKAWPGGERLFEESGPTGQCSVAMLKLRYVLASSTPSPPESIGHMAFSLARGSRSCPSASMVTGPVGWSMRAIAWAATPEAPRSWWCSIPAGTFSTPRSGSRRTLICSPRAATTRSSFCLRRQQSFWAAGLGKRQRPARLYLWRMSLRSWWN